MASRDRLDIALRRLVERVDRKQPYARQLEQIAEVAVGEALRRTEAWRHLLPHPPSALRDQIELAVADFAAAPNQERLHTAARQTGVSQLDVLTGLVLRHCHEALRPLTEEQVARYALAFALRFAEARPALAEQYRRWLARR